MATSKALNSIYEIRGALTPAWNLPTMVLDTIDDIDCDPSIRKIIKEEADRSIGNQGRILECLRQIEEKLIELGEET